MKPNPPSPTNCKHTRLWPWIISVPIGLLVLVMLGSILGVRSSRPWRKMVALTEGTPSPANPIYSHSLNIRDMGRPSDDYLGSFSISPDGKRLGLIITDHSGGPIAMLLCDLDGSHVVEAPTAHRERRAPLWCSNNRIVTGASGSNWNSVDISGTAHLTVWDSDTGKILSQVVTQHMAKTADKNSKPTINGFSASYGVLNPKNPNEILLALFSDSEGLNVYRRPPLMRWNIDTNTFTRLPKREDVVYHGITWLPNGDILAYGETLPANDRIKAERDQNNIDRGEGFISILAANGLVKQWKDLSIYKEPQTVGGKRWLECFNHFLTECAQPDLIDGVDYWPMFDADSSFAYYDIKNFNIVRKVGRFRGLGWTGNMTAVLSASGRYIYYTRYPDLWVYDLQSDTIVKQFRTGAGGAIHVTPDGKYLLVINRNLLDFYKLKP